MTNGSGVVGAVKLSLNASSDELVWHLRFVIGILSLVILWSLVIGHWSFNRVIGHFSDGGLTSGSLMDAPTSRTVAMVL